MNITKGLNFFLKILGHKVTKRREPLTVIFNVTHRCNCRCRHCYAAYYSRNPDEMMSTEKIKTVLEDLKANGCVRVSYSGGEPLLREDIEELIDYANLLGMGVTVNSNGILVPNCIAVLKKVDALAVSLDGRPEHHDMIRGKGTGEKALKGIKSAVRSGIRVHTNTVLNRYNLNDIDYILDIAGTFGLKAEFALAISNIFKDDSSKENYKPTTKEFREAITYIIQRKRAGAPILFSAESYESVLNSWHDFSIEGIIDGPTPVGMPMCPAGRFFCIIEADGTLCACPHLLGKTRCQNVLEVGVEEAWKLAQKHPCVGCYQVYHHEFSKLMNLELPVVWNYVKLLLQR